jgi:hypothetical protein
MLKRRSKPVRRRRKLKAGSGASLIELVVVLAGFMILLLCSGQFVGIVQRMVARAELGLLALTIRTEQQKALLTGTEKTIVFGPEGSGYVVAAQRHQFQHGITLGAPPGAYGPPGDPRAPITRPLTFPNRTITCYPRGSIQAGTVYLKAPAYRQYYAITAGVAQFSFLRLYQYRLDWIPL